LPTPPTETKNYSMTFLGKFYKLIIVIVNFLVIAALLIGWYDNQLAIIVFSIFYFSIVVEVIRINWDNQFPKNFD